MNLKAFISVGALTFIAAKFIFDASTQRALIAGGIVGAIAGGLAGMAPGSIAAPTGTSQAGSGTPAPPATVPPPVVTSAPNVGDVLSPGSPVVPQAS